MKPPYIVLSRKWLDREPHLCELLDKPDPDEFLRHLCVHPQSTEHDRQVLAVIGWGRICIEEHEDGLITISRAED
jgi:hypothetical protein